MTPMDADNEVRNQTDQSDTVDFSAITADDVVDECRRRVRKYEEHRRRLGPESRTAFHAQIAELEDLERFIAEWPASRQDLFR